MKTPNNGDLVVGKLKGYQDEYVVGRWGTKKVPFEKEIKTGIIYENGCHIKESSEIESFIIIT